MDYAYFTKRKKRLSAELIDDNTVFQINSSSPNFSLNELEINRQKCYHLIETLKLMNPTDNQNLPDDSFFQHRSTFYEIIL